MCKTIRPVLVLLVLLAILPMSGRGAERNIPLTPILSLLLTSPTAGMDIAQLVEYFASRAEKDVAAGDKAQIRDGTNAYSEGGQGPYFISGGDGPVLVIPSRGAAFYIFGSMAVIGNSRTVALWCFAEAARRDPQNPMYLNNFAFLLMDFGYFREARTVLRFVAAQAPEFLSARVNLALAEAALNDYNSSGAGFHAASALFPQQEDYYYLGSQAYHLAGRDQAAWAMASLGQQYHADQFDFASLLASLDYPSTPGTCSMPLSCLWNESCYDFLVYGSYESLIAAGDWEGDYMTNVFVPTENQIYANRDQCLQAAANRGQLCLDSTPQPLQMICYCRAWIEEAYCDISFEQAIYGNYAVYYGKVYGRYLQAQGETEAALKGITAQLQPGQYEYLRCELLDEFASLLDATAEEERNVLSIQMGYIGIARNNLQQVVSACNEHCSSFEYWFYTSGTSFNTEPAVCYGPVCLSFGADGQLSASFAFGPALKFSYDPLKEQWGLALGLGVQFGAGQWAAGGALLLKLGPDQKGFAVTGGALYASAERFFGFQRMPVKVSYP